MPLPPRYLRDRQTVVWIERALSMAENRASALSETLWIYASQILSPSSGNADTGAVRNLISSLDGLRRYWVEVERPFYELIANMAGSTEPYPTKELKEWGSALSRMADRALDSTLDSGESNARTLKAGSRARSVFKMKMRKIRQKEDCSYE